MTWKGGSILASPGLFFMNSVAADTNKGGRSLPKTPITYLKKRAPGKKIRTTAKQIQLPRASLSLSVERTVPADSDSRAARKKLPKTWF